MNCVPFSPALPYLINLLTHRPQPSLPPHCPLPPMLGNIFTYSNQYPPSLLADLECMLATCFLQSFLHMFVLQGNNRTAITKHTSHTMQLQCHTSPATTTSTITLSCMCTKCYANVCTTYTQGKLCTGTKHTCPVQLSWASFSCTGYREYTHNTGIYSQGIFARIMCVCVCVCVCVCSLCVCACILTAASNWSASFIVEAKTLFMLLKANAIPFTTRLSILSECVTKMFPLASTTTLCQVRT